MADTTALLDRIDAEFRGVEERIKKHRESKVHEYEGRQQRFEQYVAICDQLKDVWRPRFEALAERFRERVKITPNIGKSRRSATIRLHTPLARFDLTFTAMTDEDVRNLVLDSTLDVLPILMKFEKNNRLEVPLDAVDPEVVGKWMDDRIVDAVKTYLQLHQNAHYLKGHLVVDPIAKVEFPKYAAGATLDWKGQTQYFIGEETRDEFARANGISVPQSK